MRSDQNAWVGGAYEDGLGREGEAKGGMRSGERKRNGVETRGGAGVSLMRRRRLRAQPLGPSGAVARDPSRKHARRAAGEGEGEWMHYDIALRLRLPSLSTQPPILPLTSCPSPAFAYRSPPAARPERTLIPRTVHPSAPHL